jgi:hypothetical protein
LVLGSAVFNGIPANAGDPEIEEKAFSVATYGRHLGLITEVLIDLAEQAGTASTAAASLERLTSIRAGRASTVGGCRRPSSWSARGAV